MCSTAVNLTTTSEIHGGRQGLTLCKVHLRQHVKNAARMVLPTSASHEPDTPSNHVDALEIGLEEGRRCKAIKKKDGQICNNKLKPDMIDFCGKHQPRR